LRELARTESAGTARTRTGWRTWGATGLGLVALLVSLAFWDVAARPGPRLCLFQRLTGLACPACGLTRAAALAAHGRFAAAVALHPALPVLALEAAVAWVVWGVRLASGRRRLARWEAPVAVATAAALVLLWLARLATGTLPP
jgi:hypothetical protein